MLRNQQEDELNQLLAQTYTNNEYLDEQLREILKNNQQTHLKRFQSSQSMPSSGSDNISNSQYVKYEVQDTNIQQFYLNGNAKEYKIVLDQAKQHVFEDIYYIINNSLKAVPIEEVRHQYPLFLLSQPQYQLKDYFKVNNIIYGGYISQKVVQCMDVGYCQQEKIFKVALGNVEGQIIIFDAYKSKAQQILTPFKKRSKITNIKWSKNLQYLSITSQNKQLLIYTMKQIVMIQNQINYRINKNAVEYCLLEQKQLKNNISLLYYIEENPLKMLVVNDQLQIIKLEIKKNFINFRPFLTKFQLQFQHLFELQIVQLKDKMGNRGKIMAVSCLQFVNICQIQPNLEIAMVYDKDKHGGHLKKNGYPHVSIEQSSASMIVIWDKYLQILNLQVQSFHPFQHKFSITHRFLLPESSILAGFLSNTLIYQLNPLGIKIYSKNTFQKQLSPIFKNKQIYFQHLKYENLPMYSQLQQLFHQTQIQPSSLLKLKKLLSISNKTLFYTQSSKYLKIISFNTIQEYISRLIQNNNYKIGLQLLKDCYSGKVYNLDDIMKDIIHQKIKQISIRYINFLQTIIIHHQSEITIYQNKLSSSSNNNNKYQLDNIEILWNQELIFIFNILLNTELELFLLEEIFNKLIKLNIIYITNIIPFILINKIKQITQKSLLILFKVIPKDIISKLIFNLQCYQNDPQLSHQINNVLVREEMYLEFIDLNMKFQDYYTILAVLVSLYLKIENDDQKNIIDKNGLKHDISHLLAYAFYQILLAINSKKLIQQKDKQTMQSIIFLLKQQIFTILIEQYPLILFQTILQQLLNGNTLQILIEKSTQQVDEIHNIIKYISYPVIINNKCQKTYWIFILKLYRSKILTSFSIFIGLRYLTIDDHIDKIELEKIVNKCQKQIIEELSLLSQDSLNTFYEDLSKSQHICLIILVGNLLRKYIRTLSLMLSFQCQRNINIYSYIEDILRKMPNTELQLFRHIFKENIKLFTFIDAKKASDIICKYFLPDLNLFIDDLFQYPRQQLKLIRQVLQLYAYSQSLTNLKVKYLELLAIQEYYDDIYKEIKKENYPLDESIKICKFYKVNEALGYLLVKSGGQGDIEAAIKVYFMLIEQKINKKMIQNNRQISKQQIKDIILLYVRKCIHICSELDIKNHEEYDNEWFIIIEQLQNLKRSFYKKLIVDNQNCQEIKFIINKIAYPELVRMLIFQVKQENIIHYLSNAMKKIEIQALQIVIEEIVKNYIFQKRMYKISEEIFTDAENYFRNLLFKQQLKGFRTASTCDVCHQKGQLVVHYGCGHENHPSCSQDVKECILCSQKSQVIFSKRINNLMGLRIDIYSKGVKRDLCQIESEISKQLKLTKLKQYEELYNQNYDIFNQ